MGNPLYTMGNISSLVIQNDAIQVTILISILIKSDKIKVYFNRNICIGSKCPDILWLSENSWREEIIPDEYTEVNGEVDETKNNSKIWLRNVPIYEYPFERSIDRYVKKKKNQLIKEYK
jgi:hypothetical protein